MTKKTPFYEVSKAAGADMRELFGYYLPLVYGVGHEAEHLGTRQKASLCDLDYMAEFSIKGPDAVKFTNMLLTADVSKQKVGQIKYTAICVEAGLMIDDGTIWRMAEDEFLLITGDEGDFEWISGKAQEFDVEVKNLTAEWTSLALQGPAAEAIAKKIVDTDFDALRYYWFTKVEVDGVSCVFDRMGYTGERGFEFHFAPRYGEKMWNLIMEAGAEFGIVPCGQMALESLRQEAGYLLVGNDHNKQTNPLEAGIGFAVKLDKADFYGRDALISLANQGLKRTLVWFRLPGGEIAETGDTIMLGGRQVGVVTSGSYSPTHGGGTAVGYVDPAHAIAGIAFTICSKGGEYKAMLSLMPLYDPDNSKTKTKA